MNAWKLYLIYSIRFQNLDLGVGSNRIIPRHQGAYNSLSDISTYPEEVISRERLLKLALGWEYPARTRTVDTRMFERGRVTGNRPVHAIGCSAHGSVCVG
jgi:hypothetical protein